MFILECGSSRGEDVFVGLKMSGKLRHHPCSCFFLFQEEVMLRVLLSLSGCRCASFPVHKNCLLSRRDLGSLSVSDQITAQ